MDRRTYVEKFTEALKTLFLTLLPVYIGTAHSRAGTKIIQKDDGTPVGDLDNYALEQIRNLIIEHFPGDCIVGEEDKKSKGETQITLRTGKRVWLIDGLDGTWHFMRGTNSYGAMVSLCEYGTITYAAIFRPIDMALRGNGFFFAKHGEGAWEWCSEHGEYHLLSAALPGQLERRVVLLEGSSKRFFQGSMADLGKSLTTRPSLSSCIAATTIARGDATAVVTIGHAPWDGIPICIFIEEAGGVVTDHKGNPVTPDNCGAIIAAGNAKDHAHILGILNPTPVKAG